MGTKDTYTTSTDRSTASSDSHSDEIHRVEPQRWARAYMGVGGRMQFVDDEARWIACDTDDVVEVRA
jgi:hypothetical protein